jgi:hypothetical protein
MQKWTEIETGVDSIVVRLHPTERQIFGSWVDCNMSTAWVGDRFRIFPGKYGEDPVWGDGNELKFGEGSTVAETFALPKEAFIHPSLPQVVKPTEDGLHGSVWFESVYQDQSDTSGRTLFALYHNENYPSTLIFRPETGEGLRDADWPPGLLGDSSIQAVPRIGIMKSTDGGDSWENLGILLEDRDERMIRLPINKNYCFPGGVGDPSAIADGDYLYVFFGEYAYPGAWSKEDWSAEVEASGQCVSVARVLIKDLENPTGKAKRWDGKAFAAEWDGIGQPIRSLQIPASESGGAVSQGDQRYYWGPSVSWNEEIQCWVMMLGRVDGPFWVGDSLFLSINPNRNLGEGDNSQQWSKPVEVVRRPGHTLWYPSLQPDDSPESLEKKRTCLRLGRFSKLWFKDMTKEEHLYLSDFMVELVRKDA